MRTFVAIATVTLAIALVSRPMQGQVHAGDTPFFKTIHMVDSQTGWAVWIDQLTPTSALMRTTDGGTHWRDVTPLNSSGNKIYVSDITALSGDVAWVIPHGPRPDSQVIEIFRTTDGGHSWGRSSVPGSITSDSSISFISPREGWFLAHGDMFSITGRHGEEWVYIFQSTDGGETWFVAGSKCPGTPSEPRRSEDELPRIIGPTSIAFLNSRTGWVTGNTLTPNLLYLYVTHDCGHSWQQQNIPLPYELTPQWHASLWAPKFFTPQDGILPALFSVLDESLNPTRMFVIFYATRDGGSTWTRARPVSIDLRVMTLQQSVADMNHAWVMNGDALRGTTDGGRSWRMLTQNSLFHNVVQLDFVSPKVGWAVREEVVHTSTSPLLLRVPPFLLKTLDGGRTWVPVTHTVSRQ